MPIRRRTGTFAPTRFVQPAYTAACVPFRWMLREKVEGDAKKGESRAGGTHAAWLGPRIGSPSSTTGSARKSKPIGYRSATTSSLCSTPSSARCAPRSRSVSSTAALGEGLSHGWADQTRRRHADRRCRRVCRHVGIAQTGHHGGACPSERSVVRHPGDERPENRPHPSQDQERRV